MERDWNRQPTIGQPLPTSWATVAPDEIFHWVLFCNKTVLSSSKKASKINSKKKRKGKKSDKVPFGHRPSLRRPKAFRCPVLSFIVQDQSTIRTFSQARTKQQVYCALRLHFFSPVVAQPHVPNPQRRSATPICNNANWFLQAGNRRSARWHFFCTFFLSMYFLIITHSCCATTSNKSAVA